MKRLLPAVLVLVAAVVAWVAFRTRDIGDDPPERRDVPVAAVPGASIEPAATPAVAEDPGLSASMRVPTLASTNRSGPYRPADWPALPAPEAPVAAVFDTLQDRARRGDAGAACRLVFDLTSCRQALTFRLAIERGKDAPPDGFGMPRDNAGQRQLLSRCQGLGARHFSAQYGLLKQSALAGHELSLGFYLSGELFRRDATAHIDFLDDFRAEAPRMFESALQQGSVSAAALAGLAESGSPVPFLPEAVRDDPVERQAMALLSLSAIAGQASGPSRNVIETMREQMRRQTTLTPEAFARAEQLAAERTKSWFADSTGGRAVEEARAMVMSSRGARMDPNRLCTSGYGHALADQPLPEWRR